MEWEVEKPKKPIRINPDSKDRLAPYRDKHPKTLEQIEIQKLEEDFLADN
jgi:hypothetical protein